MVGFICESAKEDVDGVVNQLKSKTSNEPERHNSNREAHSTELDGLSLPSLEPFVDFDFIEDWIEEMQVPDSEQFNKSEIGSGLCENSFLENPIGNCLAQGMGNYGSAKVEGCGTDELVVEDIGGIVGVVRSDGFEEPNLSDFVKADLGSSETKYNSHQSEIMSSDNFEDAPAVGKLGSLNCSIEDGLKKVSLAGGIDDFAIDVKDMKETESKVVNNETELDSDSDSESESDTSSSSSSSASSSGSDDDSQEMVKEEKLCKTKSDCDDQKIDVEEGEIMVSDVEKMVTWTDDGNNDDDVDETEDDSASEFVPDLELGDDIDDDGDTDLPKGPIRSKNELQDLPPVPLVTVNLQPGHHILPVGVVLSVLGTQVIVEGSVKHNPISEGSILWIVERRLPLGIIDEIFGPVKTPYYMVRYNSESEVPADIQNGTNIGFVSEFADHVLNDKSLYQKGYDASGENDEEICEETEFSDDEKEAEYRKMLKLSKRGNTNESQGSGNKKKNRKNAKSRENTWTKNQQPFASQSPTLTLSQPNKIQQPMRSPSPCFTQGNQSGTSTIWPVFSSEPSAQSSGQSNQAGQSHVRPNFSARPHTFTQMPHRGPVPLNGNWNNGMPLQTQNMPMSGSGGFQPNGNWPIGIPPQAQNMAMPNGLQLNGMPWVQPNYPGPVHMPLNTQIPWQHQQQVSQFPLGISGPSQPLFDLSQLLMGINGSPVGPMNFNMGAPNAPWSGMLGPNLSGQAPFMAGFQNPNSQFPAFSGFMPNGPQPAGDSSNSGPAASFSGNEEASSQTHQGGPSGRGRGRRSFQQRGGRSGGRRGR